ncbi:MAG TPA: hypothetical protein VLG10_16825 [Methylomirabilota bacterium]|nr:hypothetical protein [Methylomirabilota bacterium]
MGRGTALFLAAALLAGYTPVRSPIGGDSPEQLADIGRAARDVCQLRRGQVPSHAFTSDACSLWPDGAWPTCCVDHDKIYWRGGTAEERKKESR